MLSESLEVQKDPWQSSGWEEGGEDKEGFIGSQFENTVHHSRKPRIWGTRSLCSQSPVSNSAGGRAPSGMQANQRTGDIVWVNQKEWKELFMGIKRRSDFYEGAWSRAHTLRMFLDFQLELRSQCVGSWEDGKRLRPEVKRRSQNLQCQSACLRFYFLDNGSY